MKTNMQKTFELDGKVVGKILRGSEFPQAPDHPDPIGTLSTDISFEGIVIEKLRK